MSQAPYPNPFEAPRTTGPTAIARPGVLDIGAALSEGWQATLRNFGPWLAVLIVGGIVGFIAAITVIGAFVVVPVLFWGGVVFTLKSIDGQASLGDLFSGFSNYGQALGSMLGWFILTILISLPGQIVVQMAAFTGSDSALALLAIGYIIQLAWTFGVVMRFYFAPYYIVDKGLGPVEALKASWNATSEQKLTVALFGLVTGLVILAGFIVLIVGVIPALMVVYSAWAAAYRQLSGTSGPSGARSAF